MHVEFLVEEPSAEAALANLLPQLLSPRHTFKVHPHQGKRNLLSRLPGRLAGYAKWLPDDWRIVVLIDADQEDCRRLKERLEREAGGAGLRTLSGRARGGAFQVINRLAVEELEAWFLVDVDALRAAYPRVPASVGRRAPFRDPDRVGGGTWEALERVLQRAGYYREGMLKIEVARSVSRHMDPAHNRSHSFGVFRDALLLL